MRSKTSLKLSVAALAAFSATACVNLTPDMVYPIGTAGTLDAAYIAKADATDTDTISTAKSGDILLRQPVQNAAVFVLENDVLSEGNISLAVQERKLNLNKGEIFYGAVNVGQETALVACSHGRPATHIPRLNPGAQANGKICFELEPIEGKIDLETMKLDKDVYTSDQFFFVVDGAFAITEEAGPFQKLARWDPQFIYTVSPPAELRRTAEAVPTNKTAPELGLRYIYANGEAQLEPVYVADDLPSETAEENIKIDQTQDFPFVIEHDGAEIELLAITDGVLAYRILSGFETKNTFVMDLPE